MKLDGNTGKLLAVAPFDEGMLSESELFVVNKWVRPSVRYVYGRIKLNPERKDFYREKIKGNPPDARGNGAGDYLFGEKTVITDEEGREKTRVNFISQNALRGYLPEYRLSKVYMMQCYSAAGSHQSMWSQKAVSFLGTKA